MIDRFFEPFTLLEDRSNPDGMGGTAHRYVSGTAFRGALTANPGAQVEIAGQMCGRYAAVLVHDREVTLHVGDHVRRDKTGSVFCVTGSSELMQPPDCSGLNFAQAEVERVVLP